MKEQTIVIAFYGNPDYYPPTLNAVKILSKNYKIVIVCRNHKKNCVSYPDNVSIIRLGRHLNEQESAKQNSLKKIVQYFTFTVETIRIVIGSKCRVVIVYDMHAFVASLILKVISRRKRLIYHCHDSYESHRSTVFMRLIKWLEVVFGSQADKVVFPNKNRAEIFMKEAKLKEMPLVVANTHLLLKEKPKGVLRQELVDLGYSPKEPIVLHQGTLCNNQYTLSILESIKDWKKGICVMIGDCDQDIEDAIDSIIKKYDLNKKVYLLNYVSYDSLLSYTVDADIGLALYKPSNINLKYFAEASCKINDYIAVGVPVVTNEATDCVDVYKGEGWIKFVDVKDPRAISSVINRWLGDEDELIKSKESARKRHLESAYYEFSFKPVREYIDSVMSE